MTRPIEAFFLRTATDMAYGLLDAHGVSILGEGEGESSGERRVIEQDEIELAAVIGFTADDARGLLGIGLSRETLAAMAGPHNGTDWLGELANQWLGRLKNSLLAYGIKLTLGLPTVVKGQRLEPVSGHRTHLPLPILRTDRGAVFAWTEVELAEALDAIDLDAPQGDDSSMAEGELLLF